MSYMYMELRTSLVEQDAGNPIKFVSWSSALKTNNVTTYCFRNFKVYPSPYPFSSKPLISSKMFTGTFNCVHNINILYLKCVKVRQVRVFDFHFLRFFIVPLTSLLYVKLYDLLGFSTKECLSLNTVIGIQLYLAAL